MRTVVRKKWCGALWWRRAKISRRRKNVIFQPRLSTQPAASWETSTTRITTTAATTTSTDSTSSPLRMTQSALHRLPSCCFWRSSWRISWNCVKHHADAARSLICTATNTSVLRLHKSWLAVHGAYVFVSLTHHGDQQVEQQNCRSGNKVRQRKRIGRADVWCTHSRRKSGCNNANVSDAHARNATAVQRTAKATVNSGQM